MEKRIGFLMMGLVMTLLLAACVPSTETPASLPDAEETSAPEGEEMSA